jgi:hypothetical protein
MDNPLEPDTYAQRLIEVTKEYTLRPRKNDRVDVCVAVLEYLLNNFSYEHETCDDGDIGYSGTYVDVEDIQNLIMELNELKK